MRVPALELREASLVVGGRALWQRLELSVEPGEFLAVLGPNGAGKTTLLRVALGLQPLTAGTVSVEGGPPAARRARIGYIPQQRVFDRDVPLRGRDLVRLGLDGHRPGVPLARRAVRSRVDDAIASVGASGFADRPIGLLSGGEQQRLRVAQAMLADPALLLCDEPLLSLDPAQQAAVVGLIDGRRRGHDTAVVFVTHEINPIVSVVDRLLYLVGTRWAVGTPDEVLTSQRLSDLYASPVEVVRAGGRIVVVGGDSDHAHHVDGAGPGAA